MRNKDEDIFKFIRENDLWNEGYMFEIIKDRDLNYPDILLKVRKIRERYDNNNNKYPEGIMCQLRQRLGLEDRYDTSLDEEINNMDKGEVFDNLVSWNNLPGMSGQIKQWVKIVYGIDLDEE